ncbi:hypothetical protein L1987_70463 [Smallanthus sonchifolius]|uniref:Uncharacterized protein n=1 Tax=Smallanthus sonchifolius TaxID=185202 RepID=A0ACB9ANX9_9ASTR|nr:hypothetical protein L1987_70463 [Smallanthus sonchifolius]
MAYQGGNLKSTSINGVKMYTVAGQHRSLATWLAPKKLKALRKDKSYMERVDLIQDLRFETATTRIKATPDGEFLIASGIYPPQVKVYELRELSLKFERHLISEIINFQLMRFIFLIFSKYHGLIAGGGEDGAVECFDTRIRSSVARLNAVTSVSEGDQEVTAIEFDGDGGYRMAVGSSGGKAQAAANSMVYEEYIEKRKREKEELERSTRITIKKKLPKVNRGLAKRLLEDEELEVTKKEAEIVDTKKPNKKKKGLTSEVLQDERFTSLFNNEDFEVDESSLEYRALHPLAAPVQQSLVKEHFEPFMEEDEDQSDSDASEESQSSVDEHADGKKTRAPRLYEVKDERHAEAFRNRKSLAKEDALPLEERVKALENNKSSNGFKKVKAGPGGSREISFISRSKGKYEEDEYDDDNPREKRRGIHSLGLKSDRSGFQGWGRGGGGRGGGRGRGGGGRGRGGGGRGRGRGRGRR